MMGDRIKVGRVGRGREFNINRSGNSASRRGPDLK